MPEFMLLPEQADLLRTLVEAYQELKPKRQTFHYIENRTTSEDTITVLHPGLPNRQAEVAPADLDALADGRYIRRRPFRRMGGKFDLTAEALARCERLQDPDSGPLPADAASGVQSSGHSRAVPLLVLHDIHDRRRYPSRLALLEGRGRFAGVNHILGSRELFFLVLLFQSGSEHRTASEVMTVVTDADATAKFLEWASSGFLKFTGKDRENPRSRVRTMWGEFVRQISKEKKLDGAFTGKLTDDLGNKLYGLRLGPGETQILINDISAILELADQ